MLRATQIDIQDFLEQKRFAMVGVSRHDKDFSRELFRELRGRGYDVIPVNPNVSEIEGQPCFPHVSDIEPAVEGALLLTSAEMTEAVVHECVAAGVHRIWMHRGAGQGAVNEDAVEFCRQHGIAVIPGECPFMFLKNAGWFHRLHGFFRKLSN